MASPGRIARTHYSGTIARFFELPDSKTLPMPTIQLPDGSERQYDAGVTAQDVAVDISRGLAKNAVVARVNDELRDLTRPIEGDARVEIITRESDEGLELLRHDAAHVMAEAVKEIWPETQVTIGPAIENGFYYDFAREESFTPEDLETIEARMREIVARDETIVREVWNRDEAIRCHPGYRPNGLPLRLKNQQRCRGAPGRGLQGRNHCGSAGRRDDHALSPGRVH